MQLIFFLRIVDYNNCMHVIGLTPLELSAQMSWKVTQLNQATLPLPDSPAPCNGGGYGIGSEEIP